MKFRMLITMLLAALLISSFSGCSLVRMAERLDTAGDVVEDRIEHRADRAEDAIEDSIEQAIAPTQEILPTDPPTPLAPTPESAAPTVAPTAPATALTAEEAQAIALKHAGFTADQVKYLRTDYEIDDGVPQYEVQFHQGRFEYDYEINAETGDILSYDRDD